MSLPTNSIIRGRCFLSAGSWGIHRWTRISSASKPIIRNFSADEAATYFLFTIVQYHPCNGAGADQRSLPADVAEGGRLPATWRTGLQAAILYLQRCAAHCGGE